MPTISESRQEKATRLRYLGWSDGDIAKACKPPARKKRTTAGVLTEYEEQKALIKACDGPWGKLLGIQGWLVSVPNSGHGDSLGRASMLKATGLRAGFPDLFLPVASHHGGQWHALAIELKQATDKDGKRHGVVSAEQREWIEKLRARGWRAEVCHGCLEAQRLIAFYVTGREHV